MAPRGFRGGRSGRQANREIDFLEGGTSCSSLFFVSPIECILLNMQLDITHMFTCEYSIVNAISNCDLIVW